MNDKILLSIIVPMYNAEKSISILVKSILKQIKDNSELILVNDGSTDSTKEICEKIIKNVKNAKIITIKNNGVSNARNVGIKNSRGEYLFFIDSDDYIDENLIEVFSEKLKFINEKTLIKVNTKFVKGDSVTDFCYLSSCDSNDFRTRLLNGKIPGYSWGYFFQKKIVEKIMYNPGITFMEDLLFLYKYSFYVENIEIIDKTSYFYVANENGISQNRKFNEKHIFNGCEVLNEILEYDNTIEKQIIDKRSFKIIESEIGKCEIYNLPNTFSNELKELFKQKAQSTKSLFHKIYYKCIIKYKLLYNIYIFTRKSIKKIKKVIK